ncbi:hypothetical protein [Haloarcula marismortui]|uniref:Uncharacterized protein n=1 Tax=Haloarcula marismortui ATCC 33800 TaxID=662476 RepID=A0A8T8KC77_9EURY|nr:hypothetical protein [Haloarcula sinaiiensis]QUJ71939.1 hypothetical protein KDQ40_14795 [Haloarcula sinaiiensis ATCC 33800]
MDPEDVDLEDLINSSSGSVDDLNVDSKLELAQKVKTLGSLKLDDEGRMLISCPAYTSSNTDYICGIFPLPDPGGDGFKQVCTGPNMEIYKDSSLGSGRACASNCPYNPARLDESSDDGDDSGGLFS